MPLAVAQEDFLVLTRDTNLSNYVMVVGLNVERDVTFVDPSQEIVSYGIKKTYTNLCLDAFKRRLFYFTQVNNLQHWNNSHISLITL